MFELNQDYPPSSMHVLACKTINALFSALELPEGKWAAFDFAQYLIHQYYLSS
jgi:hypothetical protein